MATTPNTASGTAHTGEAIRLGQTLALTGPLGELGKVIHEGSRVCFEAVNAQGGIHGRRIELIGRDDGYDVKRSVANVKGFLADPDLFALYSPMGTPIVEALLPLIRNTDVPCFAPLTGATSARPADMRNVLNVTPSYPEETDRLVQHLATIGIRRFAIGYQANAFGKEVLQAAEAACKRHGVALVASESIQNDASDAAAAAAKVIAASPEAVMVGTAGKPTVGFIKSIRAQRKGVSVYALSVMGSAATISALGPDAYGVAVTQVVPLPTNAVVPVVRDFLNASKEGGVTSAPSHIALWGYIHARVMVEALRRTGRNLTRKGFIDAVWAIRRLDLGGYEVNFDQPGRNASRFVELTMISHAGKFIR